MKFFLEKLVNLYTSLSERDRNAAKLLLLCFPALIYFAVIQPLYHSYQQSRLDFESSQALLKWMLDNQENVAPQKKQSENFTAGNDLIQTLSISADTMAISFDRIQPQGDHSVRFWIQEIAFDKLVMWLSAINKQGLSIETISIDRTLNSGIVSVQCSLQRIHP
ncbi:MAG: type II secretion system protein M [Porticoccaceae bacterium]|nr:type II secretion system protein M [Porticoccaceae bacterium]